MKAILKTLLYKKQADIKLKKADLLYKDLKGNYNTSKACMAAWLGVMRQLKKNLPKGEYKTQVTNCINLYEENLKTIYKEKIEQSFLADNSIPKYNRHINRLYGCDGMRNLYNEICKKTGDPKVNFDQAIKDAKKEINNAIEEADKMLTLEAKKAKEEKAKEKAQEKLTQKEKEPFRIEKIHISGDYKNQEREKEDARNEEQDPYYSRGRNNNF